MASASDLPPRQVDDSSALAHPTVRVVPRPRSAVHSAGSYATSGWDDNAGIVTSNFHPGSRPDVVPRTTAAHGSSERRTPATSPDVVTDVAGTRLAVDIVVKPSSRPRPGVPAKLPSPEANSKSSNCDPVVAARLALFNQGSVENDAPWAKPVTKQKPSVKPKPSPVEESRFAFAEQSCGRDQSAGTRNQAEDNSRKRPTIIRPVSVYQPQNVNRSAIQSQRSHDDFNLASATTVPNVRPAPNDVRPVPHSVPTPTEERQSVEKDDPWSQSFKIRMDSPAAPAVKTRPTIIRPNSVVLNAKNQPDRDSKAIPQMKQRVEDGGATVRMTPVDSGGLPETPTDKTPDNSSSSNKRPAVCALLPPVVEKVQNARNTLRESYDVQDDAAKVSAEGDVKRVAPPRTRPPTHDPNVDDTRASDKAQTLSTQPIAQSRRPAEQVKKLPPSKPPPPKMACTEDTSEMEE